MLWFYMVLRNVVGTFLCFLSLTVLVHGGSFTMVIQLELYLVLWGNVSKRKTNGDRMCQKEKPTGTECFIHFSFYQ